MKKSNYPQLYEKFIKNLSPRIKEVFSRRFGIERQKKETLEAIGRDFGVSRERIRQIEERGLNLARKGNQSAVEMITKEFLDYFKKKGGFKREDIALEDLGGKDYTAYVHFFLVLAGKPFSRVYQKKDYHSFWTILPDPQEYVKKNLNLLIKEFEKIAEPISKEDFFSQFVWRTNLSSEVLISLLEISKIIRENKKGQLGLVEWPEISPRGIKDKAFVALRKENQPLHFSKVAELVNGYPPTVHNELIKDPRFILVGRGTYGLTEWGYLPGTVKEVIFQILKENKFPMKKEEIIKKTLAHRLVKKNTVLANLNDKRYFIRDSEGRYFLRKTKLA